MAYLQQKQDIIHKTSKIKYKKIKKWIASDIYFSYTAMSKYPKIRDT